jgi:hypothetical protein
LRLARAVAFGQSQALQNGFLARRCKIDASPGAVNLLRARCAKQQTLTKYEERRSNTHKIIQQ